MESLPASSFFIKVLLQSGFRQEDRADHDGKLKIDDHHSGSSDRIFALPEEQNHAESTDRQQNPAIASPVSAARSLRKVPGFLILHRPICPVSDDMTDLLWSAVIQIDSESDHAERNEQYHHQHVDPESCHVLSPSLLFLS